MTQFPNSSLGRLPPFPVIPPRRRPIPQCPRRTSSASRTASRRASSALRASQAPSSVERYVVPPPHFTLALAGALLTALLPTDSFGRRACRTGRPATRSGSSCAPPRAGSPSSTASSSAEWPGICVHASFHLSHSTPPPPSRVRPRPSVEPLRPFFLTSRPRIFRPLCHSCLVSRPSRLSLYPSLSLSLSHTSPLPATPPPPVSPRAPTTKLSISLYLYV